MVEDTNMKGDETLMPNWEWHAAGGGVTGHAVIAAVVLLVGADVQATAGDAEPGPRDSEPVSARAELDDADVDADPDTGVVGSDGTRAGGSLLAYLEEKRHSILYSLRTMPADRYDEQFVPGQRTFGQQARHVAEMNYAVCSALAGEAPPTPSAGHESPKKRLVELARRSFEYCRGIVVDHGDSVMSGAFETPDGSSLPKAKMLFFLVGNWADHYGHFATYLRMSGLEPPDTWALPADILQATTRR